MTLHQLDRGHYCSVNQACEGPILNPIKETEFFFIGDLFEKLVRRKNNGVDDGDGNERVIDAIEQSQEAFLFDNVSKSGHHSQRWVHLHSNLDGVENIAGETVTDSRDSSGQHVSYEVVEVHRVVGRVINN